jgi:OOP family OmpA-OmpF porin
MKLALAIALALPTAASANVEIGGTAGFHEFSDASKLGTPTGSTESEKNTALFGARLGFFFNDMLGVEFEAGFIPSEPRSMTLDVYNVTYRGQLVYQFGANQPEKAFIPFVFAGGGAVQIVYSKNTDILKKGVEAQGYVGFGAKYRAPNNLGLRADLRIMAEPGQSGLAIDGELLLSLYREFGRPKVEKKKTPVVDDDPDHDGIKGAADKCPNEPEDFDGFEDADGCPDPDNDKDGIPDAQDKCPNEPEDKDGFEDADGCPDPDNDKDGIPDVVDKCPNEPETFNGYQDADGCPDEIPAAVKKFSGVIQGINFKVNSAEILATSNKTLDDAVKVLTEFKDVRLEIQGHTDDQPIAKGGKFASNEALSQARAEAVREYMVKKGVPEDRLVAKGYGDASPIDDPKGLAGAKLNTARTKNRRVEFKLIQATPAPTPAPTKTPAAAPPAAPAAPPAKTPAPPAKTPAPPAPPAKP